MDKNLLNIALKEDILGELTEKEITTQKMLIFIRENMNFSEGIALNMPLKSYGLKNDIICDIIIEQNTGSEIAPCIIVKCLPKSNEITDDIVDELIDISDMTMAEFFIITNEKEIEMYEYDSKENSYYLLTEPLTKEEILEIMFE